jgi:hypothetical protein
VTDCLNCYEKLRFKNHTVRKFRQLVFVIALCFLSSLVNGQNKYALVIGINNYYEVKGVVSEVSLHGSINDANSIKSLLINKFGFKKSNIDTLYDGNASRDNIIAALKKKLRQCKPGDVMVFYYSGHGVWMKNTDEVKDTIKKGMNQAMLTSDLYNYDDHLKCFLRDFTLKEYFNLFVDKKIILTTIFDCCFSGNLAMAARGTIPPEQTKSVDLTALFGRLTENANNPQLLIDSIAGISSDVSKGCLTDSKGALKDSTDSDGDGVPDCRDKEKFTDKRCFPVDRDGVGNCSFDYVLEEFHKTLNKYDSAELGEIQNPSSPVTEKAFSATAVLTISEKDNIVRPVDRKNSKFLFISGTTDEQKAVEFNDENGVRHSFFTASIMRVFNKYPANTPIDELFQKIVDDMNSYHRNQNPTLYVDPSRKKNNLLGLTVQK